MSKTYLIVFIIAVILGGVFFAVSQPSATALLSGEETAASETTNSSPQTTQAAYSPNEDVNSDGSPYLPLTEKVVGSADAPITMHEFSSLSCGHCGAFHKDKYPELTKEYIDTGKLRIILIDFPTNLPALEGAMLGHCMPEDGYFEFTHELFSTQESWLTNDYKEKLIQAAIRGGLTRDEAQACLNDEQLKEAIIARTEESSEQLGINSTPSFIINNGAATIVGNKPYPEFKAALDAQLEKVDTSSDEGTES